MSWSSVILLSLVMATAQAAAPEQAVRAGQQIGAINAASSPIRKVVTMLEEMRAQVAKEGDGDQQAYDTYKCWCETNEKEKKKAIEDGKQKIEQLTAFLEEAAGKEGELKQDIETLADEIAADKDALETATALRAKENGEFKAAEAEMKETLTALVEAVKVLSKVQLLQKNKKPTEATAAEAEAFIQVRDTVKKYSGNFRGAMQKDLFDLLGSLESEVQQHSTLASTAFLSKAELLPWEKTEEQLGMEAKPNDLVGAAAGAKSYNSRSGQILGLISEMRDEFGRDLVSAQKEELDALVAYQHLRAAKIAEIEAAQAQKEQKEKQLADLLQAVAQAKEDLASTAEAVAADEKFLAGLIEGCAKVDEEYAKRAKVRGDELVALSEALKILTEDDARALFDRTINSNFLQISAVEQANMQDKAADSAMRKIVRIAKRHHNWSLAALAVSVRLDSFTKVKEAMDRMTAELKKQQAEEYAKWESCKTDIDQTDDKIKEETREKRDLAETHQRLVNAIDQLNIDIENLQSDVADSEVSLKQAGENRKAENQLFQSSAADQRAAIQILEKCLARLRDFYGKKSLLETAAREPGKPNAPEPSKLKMTYSKSAGAGGVLQVITMVIEDATRDEQELVSTEQQAQEQYAVYAQETSASIEANRASIAQKQGEVASAEASKSETEEAQAANNEELASLAELMKSIHLDCDFLLKYFDIRQTARKEELESIAEAKAILSGADFGKVAEE